ncbi:MAG TPA: rhodanese-related sulfurtransferase [Fimbriimonadaceae bacterium]|jgi:UPF0176 protein
MPSLYKVAAFYKFVPLPNYKELRDPLQELGARHDIIGTVLLASEGINATIAGSEEGVSSFLEGLHEAGPFEGLNLKFSSASTKPFLRWKVRLKKEIVTFKNATDPTETVGEYVKPKQWNQVISDPAVTVIDVRNSYEIEYGSFQGAINPNTNDFWEFPQFVANQLPDKNQPIAMFCTGGIRCEKATSYLLSLGYTNVKHLEGGILRYLAEVPESESLWKGSCFVFDDREALDHSLQSIK